MATPPKIPHFAWPFRYNGSGNSFATNDQDTDEDIIACCAAILSFPIGSRSEAPTFGAPDLVFSEYDPEHKQVLEALAEWEDRASFFMENGTSTAIQRLQELISGLVQLRLGVDPVAGRLGTDIGEDSPE